MNELEQAYKAPQSDVINTRDIPSNFKRGELSYRQLMIAGWLSIVYLLAYIPVMWISFSGGLGGESNSLAAVANYLNVIMTSLWVYLILLMKKLFQVRFSFSGANFYIHAQIFIAIPMAIMPILFEENFNSINVFSVTYFVLLIPLGVLTALFGKRVLKIEVFYRGLQLYAWSNIVAGICLASVILMFFAIPIGLVSSIAMALIFFNAASEINNYSE